MDHVRGAPHHPQTQGKIERWHQTMKNRVLLENYFLPGDLERQIAAFVDHYNKRLEPRREQGRRDQRQPTAKVVERVASRWFNVLSRQP
jgi:transposase InsO family protein